MNIEEGVRLAPLTTFHIGGPAHYFAHALSLQDLKEAIVFAKEKQLSIFILGGGSNLLVDDSGFDGLVIKIGLSGIESTIENEKILLTAASGEWWDTVVAHAVHKNWWGLENLSGIPGTVGGAVVQNIGAYGQALSQSLESIEVLEIETGDVRRISHDEAAFDYRDSVFKKEAGKYVILRAFFSLSQKAAPELSYKDLAERFSASNPVISEIRDAVLAIRTSKFPDIQMEGTAGSFFRNPIVTDVEAQELKARFPDMPIFTMPETSGVKVPLAYLLDKGLSLKKFAIGGARLFERQPLVIVAARGTTSADVRSLAKEIADRVYKEYGITIKEEVVLI
jgi:UDP-N-acetylmuramate dehydrogenase